MRSAYGDEPDVFEITVSVEATDSRGAGAILRAAVEDGTAAEGGDIEVWVSGPAMSRCGVGACVDELESFLNRTFRPEFRLDAALALGAQGPFAIVVDDGDRPLVSVPAQTRLAA